MKHLTSTLFLALFTLLNCWATDISTSKVKELASEAMSEKVDGFTFSSAAVTPVVKDGITCMYVVNFQPQGWLLLSADDAVTPVIGYSESGQFKTQDMPVNLSAWMNMSNDVILCAKQNPRSRLAEWNDLERCASNRSNKAKTSGVRKAVNPNKVAPLIKVTWNQTGNYKKYCPSNSQGQAIVGCVAVAMGQAMSVCQYPERPVGSYSYVSNTYGTLYINYDNEAAYNWPNILSGANSYDEVARLLYHCGVSVDMDYTPSSSGTQSKYIAKALKRNFNYPDCVAHYDKSSYSDDDWKALVVNELVGGRAVCYHGQDTKGNYGHCFNVDGYDGNNMFHVNWGWGGSNDGYFYLNKLQDNTMGMTYDAYIGMVAGIRKPSVNPSDILLSSNTVVAGQPVGTEVADITVVSEATDPTYSYSIQGPYSAILHKYITPPFKIVDSKLVTTEKLTYDPNDDKWEIKITATNTATKASYTKDFTIHITNTSGIVNVAADNNGEAVYYDLNGRKVSTTSLPGMYIKRVNGKSYKVLNK